MKNVNKRRKEVIFEPGDWVWLHLRKERFPEKRKSKLLPRGDGPFQVLERINNNAYRLDLPSEYGNISVTFNVSDLSLFDNDADLRTNSFQGRGDDAPRTHHGLEEHNGDHGGNVHMRQGGLKKLEDARSSLEQVPSSLEQVPSSLEKVPSSLEKVPRSLEKVSSSLEMPKMPFDPLKMPLGPMTRARAKRFKEALFGLIRVHLEEFKAIGDHLKPIGDHQQRNIPIDSKLCILLEIDEH